LLLLLAQRTFFVQGLVAQADEAGGAMLRELDQCRQHLGLRRPISMRLSQNAASPAVCGLRRPVILVPQNLASRLDGTDLQAVLFHELAHVKRGDLWVNFAQTLLQIVYFYNPLLWLANAVIRRIREKAVDETVLVAMGEAAPQYPETLVHHPRSWGRIIRLPGKAGTWP
jgi:bla regulator protein BlaR1